MVHAAHLLGDVLQFVHGDAAFQHAPGHKAPAPAELAALAAAPPGILVALGKGLAAQGFPLIVGDVQHVADFLGHQGGGIVGVGDGGGFRGGGDLRIGFRVQHIPQGQFFFRCPGGQGKQHSPTKGEGQQTAQASHGKSLLHTRDSVPRFGTWSKSCGRAAAHHNGLWKKLSTVLPGDFFGATP